MPDRMLSRMTLFIAAYAQVEEAKNPATQAAYRVAATLYREHLNYNVWPTDAPDYATFQKNIATQVKHLAYLQDKTCLAWL